MRRALLAILLLGSCAHAPAPLASPQPAPVGCSIPPRLSVLYLGEGRFWIAVFEPCRETS